MLVELSVVEQRYHAVMEVVSGGVPITEVAQRYGVSRKSVHAWVRRYRVDGLAGLADRSHRPHHHPWQLEAGVEARICELRRAHPRWGPRRLVHELAAEGIDPVPSRSTVYRVLVRHQLVAAVARKRRRQDYLRWQRDAPMQLWQLDIMGSVVIANDSGGVTEAKLISGIDDHSRYAVIASVVARATARAVCSAFVAALAEYGVPEEVLTDNGKQFTGKYGRPRPAEVLFDRICRHNGIGHLLTKVRSPTTTGKIERWHQSIQVELLDPHGPFEDLAAAQAAVDAWRADYNTTRPHQALDMAAPAQRFAPVPAEQRTVALWQPPELSATSAPPAAGGEDLDTEPEPADPAPVAAAEPVPTPTEATDAVELDRVVPASANLRIHGQQFWLGHHRVGATVTIWADTSTVHLSHDGNHLKTVPSRLSSLDLARLRADGARPAGPPPARPSAAALAAGAPVEVARTVNASGNISVAGMQLSVGYPHAGRRVTLRIEAQLVHVVADNVLIRTLPITLTPTRRARLHGARAAGPAPALDQRPLRVQRRVSCRGGTQITGQRIQVGLRYAGRIVTIEVADTTLRVLDERDELITTIPRTNHREVTRHKAYSHTTNRNTG